MFGFYVNSKDFDILTDETYLDMTVAQYTIINDISTTKEIPLVKCTYDQFPNVNQALLKKINITDYICPKSVDVFVQGNNYSSNYTFFDITFKRCTGTDSKGNACQSSADIDTALDRASITIAMINTYYDFDNYTSPVQTYFDDQFYYDFVSGYSKDNTVYIRQNSIEQKDNFFRYTPKGDESNFITIQKVKENFKKEDSTKEVMTFRFVKDPQSDQYERQIFALLEVFGNIGGVNEVLEVAGKIIVGLFSGKIFLFSVISSLYQVDTSEKGNNSKGSNRPTSESQAEKNDENVNFNQKEEEVLNDDLQIQRFKTTNNLLKPAHDNLLKNDIVEKAKNNMKNRYRYNFSILDVFYNFLWPLKCFRMCKKGLNNPHTRYKLFERGEYKLMHEFDCIEFARNQRKLKMLIHWLMDTSERFMTVYQKTNAVNLHSSSDSVHSDDPAYLRVPKLFANNSKIDEHKILIDQFFVKYLAEIHTEKDINLLHGVCSYRELNNEEMIAANAPVNEDIERKYVRTTEDNKHNSVNKSSISDNLRTDSKSKYPELVRSISKLMQAKGTTANRSSKYEISSYSENEGTVEPEGGKCNLQSKLMHQISENRLFKFPKPTRLRKKKNKIEQSSDISKG